MLPNFNQLMSTPLSLDIAVLYSDIDYGIAKNKINDDYQIDMLNIHLHDIIWTLSDKEVVDIENLSEKYLADENNGIKPFEGHFMLNLPLTYYIIDKKGHLINVGKFEIIL